MWFDFVFVSDWGLFQRFASVNSMDPMLTSSIPTRRRCSNSAGTQSLWRNLAHLGTQLISAVSDPWHLQGFPAAFFPRIFSGQVFVSANLNLARPKAVSTWHYLPRVSYGYLQCHVRYLALASPSSIQPLGTRLKCLSATRLRKSGM